VPHAHRLDRGPKRVRPLESGGGQAAGEAHLELLAPVPAHDVRSAARLLKMRGQRPQHRVPVAVQVVELLAVIDVDEGDPRGRAAWPATRSSRATARSKCLRLKTPLLEAGRAAGSLAAAGQRDPERSDAAMRLPGRMLGEVLRRLGRPSATVAYPAVPVAARFPRQGRLRRREVQRLQALDVPGRLRP